MSFDPTAHPVPRRSSLPSSDPRPGDRRGAVHRTRGRSPLSVHAGAGCSSSAARGSAERHRAEPRRGLLPGADRRRSSDRRQCAGGVPRRPRKPGPRHHRSGARTALAVARRPAAGLTRGNRVWDPLTSWGRIPPTERCLETRARSLSPCEGRQGQSNRSGTPPGQPSGGYRFFRRGPGLVV